MNRLFKITHFLLMFISVIGVADASRIERSGPGGEGFYPAFAAQAERERDRRYADLARQNRKGRESTQRKAGRMAAASAAVASEGVAATRAARAVSTRRTGLAGRLG